MESHNLKAFLWPDNYFDNKDACIKDKCYKIQDYRYHCFRKRDEFGNPNGAILSDYLEFTYIASSVRSSKVFYKHMGEKASASFTFFFNVSFDDKGKVNIFDDGLVAKGYVIDMEESCANDDVNGEEQLLIHVKLLLNMITYIGKEKIHNLIISND